MNRIRRYLGNQLRQSSVRCARLEGRLSRERGEPLNALVLRAWESWPGDNEVKAGLLSLAVLGYIEAVDRNGGDE